MIQLLNYNVYFQQILSTSSAFLQTQLLIILLYCYHSALLVRKSTICLLISMSHGTCWHQGSDISIAINFSLSKTNVLLVINITLQPIQLKALFKCRYLDQQYFTVWLLLVSSGFKLTYNDPTHYIVIYIKYILFSLLYRTTAFLRTSPFRSHVRFTAGFALCHI